MRILIWLWRKQLFSVLIKIHKCVSLSFYAHINIVIMHDDVALFLKGKHVDGCSFFKLMHVRIQRGVGGPYLPGKPQVLWVSIQISI